MKLPIRLYVVVDDADPMRCSPECPHAVFPGVGRRVVACALSDWETRGGYRLSMCVAAANAAIDAEIDAMRRGSIDLRCAAAELEARKVKP